ncbi:hypothetical protein A1Q1_07593 [Trichosporon asahii var. asahii CBS 2479]|uniref:3'-5' exonuclease domain-containing protein n=1 Tax=Trichosporon asahii var. asahii (strain ATCC 90039 / CBS 2479 / JCM 2466 / KCTC 7840 / NBRC 103889/ NCYC 2677 / UAMH 7654) TaxID=1186058 RepID=J6F2K8_TRIAS|nr:hypothetical protein A1Q1_07593 [Trichosporon asahii var. asahii CBS 2479]EJT51209.1 hypothetical protein A1Q1_07593 [Trichosporon asahii var. asahii CBS 2479]
MFKRMSASAVFATTSTATAGSVGSVGSAASAASVGLGGNAGNAGTAGNAGLGATTTVTATTTATASVGGSGGGGSLGGPVPGPSGSADSPISVASGSAWEEDSVGEFNMTHGQTVQRSKDVSGLAAISPSAPSLRCSPRPLCSSSSPSSHSSHSSQLALLALLAQLTQLALLAALASLTTNTQSKSRPIDPAPSPPQAHRRPPPPTSSSKPLHPFFTRPRVPVPRQPRLVATYASTSSSLYDSQSQSTSQSQSQSQGTEFSQSSGSGSFFSSNTEFFSAASELSFASQSQQSQESGRSRGDVVSPPHGEPSFRPSTHISDLTAELLRLDIRADAGIDDRGWTERTGERDRAIRAVRAGVQRRTASMTLAKEVMEPTAAEWPALSPTSRTVPLKTGYASVAKKGVTTAATAKVESPMVETTLEKPPSRPTSPTTKTAAKPPTPPPPATAQHPPKPPTDEPSDLPVFSHKIPIKGHFTRPPNVAYTTDPAEVEDLIGCLRGPLSLDLEWPPPGQGKAIPRKLRGGKIVHIRRPVYDAKLGKNVWPEAPVSVVQIADARLVIVFQMLHDPEIHVRARTQGRNLTMPHSMPPALLRLLADPERVKCGVNIKQDGNKLWRDFGVPTAGLLELSAVARHVDSARWPDKGLISLARLAAAYLGADLDKGDVRTGDWSARLDAEQGDGHDALHWQHVCERGM